MYAPYGWGGTVAYTHMEGAVCRRYSTRGTDVLLTTVYFDKDFYIELLLISLLDTASFYYFWSFLSCSFSCRVSNLLGGATVGYGDILHRIPLARTGYHFVLLSPRNCTEMGWNLAKGNVRIQEQNELLVVTITNVQTYTCMLFFGL